MVEIKKLNQWFRMKKMKGMDHVFSSMDENARWRLIKGSQLPQTNTLLTCSHRSKVTCLGGWRVNFPLKLSELIGGKIIFLKIFLYGEEKGILQIKTNF